MASVCPRELVEEVLPETGRASQRWSRRVSSQGKLNPRGGKRKMRGYYLRRRGADSQSHSQSHSYCCL